MIKQEKDIPFLMAISYLTALFFIRVSVFLAGSGHTKFADAAKEGLKPGVQFYLGRNIILFGYHIHHFYIGILLICVAAWLAIVGSRHFTRKNLAIMYGAGLGLFLDEIGLLLTWGDYYSTLSYTISLFVLGVFFNIVFFGNFWESVKINIDKSKSRSLIWNKFFKNNLVFNIIDKISNKTGKTENATLVFSGILYIFVSLFIFKYTEFLRYWVAVTFIFHGATCFVRVFNTGNKEG